MKKLHIVIAILIIALAIAGAFLFVSSSRSVELGSSTFELPDKFTVKENVTTNNLSVVHIKKGNTVLSVVEVKDSTNLDDTINAFKESVKDKGTVKVDDFNAGDPKISAKKVVYKRNLTDNETNKTDNTVTTRYYAKKDNSIYFVESKSEKGAGNKAIDTLAREIIKSLHKK